MDLHKLLHKLELHGVRNDANAQTRKEKFLNITRDTGEFLSVLLKATRAHTILEVGTSNGYSTLWLASALPANGTVTTLESQPQKIAFALANFEKANLAHKITLLKQDAADYFFSLDNTRFDLIFLDAQRSEYMGFVQEIVAALRPGGLLVCDNAVSHAEELADFMAFFKGHSSFSCALVPVGKGEFMAYKEI
jgi:predicted O-methyltransferase YrrM